MTPWVAALWLACTSPDPVPADTGFGSEGCDAMVTRTDEPVAFPAADGLALEGVLSIPDHAQGTPDCPKMPAIVLVHGSGPSSRDTPMAGQLNMSFGYEIEVFVELADALAEAGWMVLRYDKRSCTPLNGCDNDYPPPSTDLVAQDFIDDAVAALDWLAQDTRVGRRVVVGHSQGGSFVPAVLQARPDLAGGVMLAGPYDPIDAVIADQLASTEALLAALGYTQDESDSLLADLILMVEQLAELRAGTYTGLLIGGASVAFWEDWMRISDEAPGIAATVDAPILAISGDYDWNVPPAHTESWGDLLTPLDRGHDAVVLPCVTHALNCVSEPDWMAITPSDIGTEVDPALQEAVIDFVSGLP